jgi:hypothetical protein
MAMQETRTVATDESIYRWIYGPIGRRARLHRPP